MQVALTHRSLLTFQGLLDAICNIYHVFLTMYFVRINKVYVYVSHGVLPQATVNKMSYTPGPDFIKLD